MIGILDILILLPLLGAILIGFGAPARTTAIAVTGVNLVLGLLVFFWSRGQAVDEYGYFYRYVRPISSFPEISWALGIDGLSLVMVMLTVVVSFAAVWVSRGEEERGAKLLYSSVLLIACGAMGAFLATDLFFFYAFHELALIPTFLAIGLCGYGEKRAAAWKITIYLGVGSIVLLAGLVALVGQLGGGQLTFDMLALKDNAAANPLSATVQGWIFLVLGIGFGILVSLFPFHSWAAPAYASAPTPVAMLHAGVLKKFGLYGLIRLALPLLPEATTVTWVLNLILILLLGNILVIGLVTIAERRLDLMLGNSSVMHMGYIFLGVVCYNTVGMSGAILLMFAHGVSIALLFALCGQMRNTLGTVRFDAIGGLAKDAPGFALAFGMAAFASVGLPGFANFAGEALVFLGTFRDFDASEGLGGLQIAAFFAVWGVVISAVYMLRAYRSLFHGEPVGEGNARVTEGTWRVAAVVLIVALLIVGIFPNVFLGLMPEVAPGLESVVAPDGGVVEGADAVEAVAGDAKP